MTSTRVDRYEVRRKQLLESRDAVKAARPVRRGDDGKGAASHLASVLPYFLTLGDEAQERDLERGLVSHIRDFLMELGTGFAFVGSQYPLEVSGKEYRIDLLFYHIPLHRYVVIDLKMGEFEPQHSGQMSFYVAAVDNVLRTERDDPTIGIILCKSKDRTTVEYALQGSNQPISVSSYQFQSKLPPALQKSFPTAEQLEIALNTAIAQIEASPEEE